MSKSRARIEMNGDTIPDDPNGLALYCARGVLDARRSSQALSCIDHPPHEGNYPDHLIAYFAFLFRLKEGDHNVAPQLNKLYGRLVSDHHVRPCFISELSEKVRVLLGWSYGVSSSDQRSSSPPARPRECKSAR